MACEVQIQDFVYFKTLLALFIRTFLLDFLRQAVCTKVGDFLINKIAPNVFSIFRLFKRQLEQEQFKLIKNKKLEQFWSLFKDFKMKKNRPNVGSMPLKGGGDEKPETEIDLNPILSLPVSVIQAGIVDQNNYISVLEVITRVETTVEFHKKIVSPNFHKFLSFCLNLLELEVQSDQQIRPLCSDPASRLNPIKLAIRLKPRESIELKRRYTNTL